MKKSSNATGLYTLVLLATAALWPLPVQAQLAPVPPPPQQFRANCESPTYASDMYVCENPELLELDQQMARLLDVVGDAAVNPTSSWIEDQESWFRRRSMCAMQADQGLCLQASYQERNAVLEAIARGPIGGLLDCRARGSLEGTTIRRMSNNSLAVWKGDGLIAVGILVGETMVWKPNVSVKEVRKKFILNLPDGSRASCR